MDTQEMLKYGLIGLVILAVLLGVWMLMGGEPFPPANMPLKALF